MKAILFALCILGLLAPGCRSPQTFPETIFQVSTLDSLMVGQYDAVTTFRQLKHLGDFGLGTFDQLDGEMIELDGQCYQVKANGHAYAVKPTMKTPFADVTFFKPDQVESLQQPLTYEQLGTYMDRMLPNQEGYYAIKIEGRFKYLKTRSEHPQVKPYPTLAEALAKQVIFEYKEIKGTMVGFRTPEAVKGISTTGYHFHFISADKKRGGHVLDCEIGQVQIAIDYSDGLEVLNP